MKTRDFSFDLPPALIAQHPPAQRGQSRLMALDRAGRTCSHHRVGDLPALLEPGTLLVFNDSRVRKARLPGRSRETGGRAEFLLLERRDPHTWKALVQRAKRRRPGSRYTFAGGAAAEITGLEGDYRLLRFDEPIDDDWLDLHGHIPLPPYIRREDTPEDASRYQTVYAGPAGSAAAPTAGLHFTGELLDRLEAAGMECVFITLHVGLGTFLPVRTENVEDHPMHREVFTIPDAAAERIERAKAEKRPVVAVGTTSVRTLESAWREGRLQRGEGSTSIFIYPGYTFQVVDALFTNFHTPASTLLMLVSAFAGRSFILESYERAVREGYRFFSYGDAMLIR
ncbi:MAG: tRNA preQ1(34) S-adenosylmethionine ribosyltransferase-isomerase QueA [Spirochaetaceae bacterium]|jgi:S-adenosylmethionine:tRNA ribosyltransferase-isomerase|nr:tRNA preQ1(34) S-adenosylmethionine ribosyltransferase-isomerase QueA [Spirochaetaceae bacterium]